MIFGAGPSRYDLSFRLASIPVAVEPWFLVVPALLGLALGDLSLVLAWVVVVFVSVLVHELGHAVAFARYGLEPRVRIHALGGVTMAAGDLGWSQRVFTSFAGPAAGFVLGAIAAVPWVFDAVPSSGFGRQVMLLALWVNLGWGMANLLPALPLDGGHILEAVLQHRYGDAGWRAARGVTAAVAAVAAVVAFAYGFVIAAALVAMFGFQAFSEMRQSPTSSHGEALERAARHVIDGDSHAALETLDSLSTDLPDGLAGDAGWIEAAALSHVDDPDRARRSLLSALLVRPAVPARLANAIQPDDESVEWVLIQLSAAPPDVAHAAYASLQRLLHRNGRFRLSVEAGRRAWELRPSPEVAWELACSFSRSGFTEVACEWLDAAVAGGLDDPGRLGSDLDLEPLRGMTDFERIRLRLGDRNRYRPGSQVGES